jgi:hypothetical protein
MGERDAAEMGANSDDDKPLIVAWLVRWKTKIGFERQNTLMICPSAIGARSTSIGAPAAMVEASGFICAISGTSIAAAPTAPTAPVATYRKSRRVCSAEDTVVTSWVLSSGWLILPPAAGARDRSLAAAGTDRLRQPWKRQDSASVAFYWHPCSTSASPQKRGRQKWPPVLRPAAL